MCRLYLIVPTNKAQLAETIFRKSQCKWQSTILGPKKKSMRCVGRCSACDDPDRGMIVDYSTNSPKAGIQQATTVQSIFRDFGCTATL